MGILVIFWLSLAVVSAAFGQESRASVGTWNQQFAIIGDGIKTLKRRLPYIRKARFDNIIKQPEKKVGNILLYNRVDFTFSPVGPRYRNSLLQDFRKSLKGSPVKRIYFYYKNRRFVFDRLRQNRFSQMPETVLFVCKTMLQKKYQGFELDNIIRDTAKNFWAVTVENNIKYLKVTAVKNPTPHPSREFRSIQAAKKFIQNRYKVGKIRDVSSYWTMFQLESLELALSRLRAKELVALRGLPFHRVKVLSQDPNRAANYHRKNNTAVINVSDNATIQRYSFMGEPSKPILKNSMVFLHEIGHAIANRFILESHDIFIRWQNQREVFESIKNFLLPQQIMMLSRNNPFNIVPLEEFIGFPDRNPILAAYGKIPGSADGPTIYGRGSVTESFAESFALYHLDPKALQRVSPAVYEFFRQQRHLFLY